MTYLERMNLQTLSFRAYGNQQRYLKVMANGIPTKMEDPSDDGNIRVYTGLKYPNLAEITTIMEKIIANKQVIEQPFKDTPAPELIPFSATMRKLDQSISAEVTATAGFSDEVQKRT